ncbi:hypothetical protein AALC75_07250 [Lachnospiraceae bacterium 48-42]
MAVWFSLLTIYHISTYMANEIDHVTMFFRKGFPLVTIHGTVPPTARHPCHKQAYL